MIKAHQHQNRLPDPRQPQDIFGPEWITESGWRIRRRADLILVLAALVTPPQASTELTESRPTTHPSGRRRTCRLLFAGPTGKGKGRSSTCAAEMARWTRTPSVPGDTRQKSELNPVHFCSDSEGRPGNSVHSLGVRRIPAHAPPIRIIGMAAPSRTPRLDHNHVRPGCYAALLSWEPHTPSLAWLRPRDPRPKELGLCCGGLEPVEPLLAGHGFIRA